MCQPQKPNTNIVSRLSPRAAATLLPRVHKLALVTGGGWWGGAGTGVTARGPRRQRWRGRQHARVGGLPRRGPARPPRPRRLWAPPWPAAASAAATAAAVAAAAAASAALTEMAKSLPIRNSREKAALRSPPTPPDPARTRSPMATAVVGGGGRDNRVLCSPPRGRGCPTSSAAAGAAAPRVAPRPRRRRGGRGHPGPPRPDPSGGGGSRGVAHTTQGPHLR